MSEKKLKRNYKDSLFRMIFNNEEKIRELYNALDDTDFREDVPIMIETLENALFVDIVNDLAFQIGGRYVVLIEHQRSLCSLLQSLRLLSLSVSPSQASLGRKGNPTFVPTCHTACWDIRLEPLSESTKM